jgi:hypothetical protein
MKSYQEFLAESATKKATPAKKTPAKKTPAAKKTAAAKKDKSSSRVNCMQEIVDELKKTFKSYSLETRKYVWEKLNSSKGKELVHKILQDPMIYWSKSPFTQLVTDTKK